MPPKKAAGRGRAASTADGEPTAAPSSRAASPASSLRISTAAHSVIRNKSGTPTEIFDSSAPSPMGYVQKYTPAEYYLAGAASEAAMDSRQPQWWVVAWMWFTTIVVMWDCTYILTRPWSMDRTNPIRECGGRRADGRRGGRARAGCEKGRNS
jgi:hypothetical protein